VLLLTTCINHIVYAIRPTTARHGDDDLVLLSSHLICRGLAPNVTAVAIPIAVTIFMTDVFKSMKRGSSGAVDRRKNNE